MDESSLKNNRLYDNEFVINTKGVTNLNDKLVAEKRTSYRFLFGDKVRIDINLLCNYPNLKKYFELEDEEYGMLLASDLSISAETVSNWLLPEGIDMYDNLVLYGKYSKDGQDHKIHSMDEFLEWYQEKEFNDTNMKESTQKTEAGKQDTQSTELKERN